jgi:hypothetical protein
MLIIESILLIIKCGIAGLVVGAFIQPIDHKPFNCELCMPFYFYSAIAITIYFKLYLLSDILVIFVNSLNAMYVALILFRCYQKMK